MMCVRDFYVMDGDVCVMCDVVGWLLMLKKVIVTNILRTVL